MKIIEGRCPFFILCTTSRGIYKGKGGDFHTLLMLPSEVYSKNHEDNVSTMCGLHQDILSSPGVFLPSTR